MKTIVIALLIIGLLLFGCTGGASETTKTNATTGTDQTQINTSTEGTNDNSGTTTDGNVETNTGTNEEVNTESTVTFTGKDVCAWLSTSEVANACGTGSITIRASETSADCAYMQKVNFGGIEADLPLLTISEGPFSIIESENDRSIVRTTFQSSGYEVLKEPKLGDYAVLFKMSGVEAYLFNLHKGNKVVTFISGDAGNEQYPAPYCNGNALEGFAVKVNGKIS
ncbi:MAG: hypothetical protein Q7S22_08810 [Candidatus Micrarchaeota archaeon]|nr:hypothetical protein [Candidatus Micrarchaeota archaeon]